MLYTPDVIVIEDLAEKGSRRGRRVKELLGRIVRLAAQREVESRFFSRTRIKETFAPAGATNKHQIATTIAAQLPELAPMLPKPRKPWMSEDCRMGIFDAAALALAFFSLDDDHERTA